MWIIFKVFIEFFITLLLFFVLVLWPQGTRDLSTLTRDGTHTLCTGRRSLNYWTARGSPWAGFFKGSQDSRQIVLSNNDLIWRPIIETSCSFSEDSCRFSSVQSLSHVQLCDLMNHSTPGLPVHHQLPEFTQNHVH